MKYLTVGTKEIREDLFKKISDTNLNKSMKPQGGLWFTEYDENIGNYNSWIDFMMYRPHILFYKNHSDNPFIQPCSVVNLKKDTKLYALHNDQTLDYLMKCFPRDSKFSYEELSNYYDGIYVNLNSLFLGKYDKNVLNKFSSFDVSSLILFNLDCIRDYQSGDIYIEPFDYEGGEKPLGYEIKLDSVKKKILKK